MQEFLLNNTVNCNLMSLTGYRTLVLLKLLLEAPRSTAEINDFFLNNEYIKEKFSNDTLRIYINSLRKIGCDITRANKSNGNKYELKSHPFDLDIEKPQLKAISKLYKNIYDKIDLKEVISLENLFLKIASNTKNEKTKDFLCNLSMLKNIDKHLLQELLTHCKNQNQITFKHNSAKSGVKEIEIIADKLAFKSEKLYLWGQSITHGEYSFYRVDRIEKISTIKFKKEKNELAQITVIYELQDLSGNYIPDICEKIIEKTGDKLLIEFTSPNKFSLMQKFLYDANNCKIISPENFKNEFLTKLKSMKESYN